MRILFTFLFLLCFSFAQAQDVIVKKTGELLNAKVLEIGKDYIKYKRGDQTDGPTYVIDLKYVYAVSYADRTQDVFTAPDSTFLKEFLAEDTTKMEGEDLLSSQFSRFYAGTGFLKDYTKVKADGSPTNSINLPFFMLGYSVDLMKDLSGGLEIGYSSYTLSGAVNDEDDEFEANFKTTEGIITANLFIQKNFPINNKFSPYLKIGLGINSSQIDSESTLNLDERGRRSLLIKSAGNVTGASFTARLGTEYYFNDSFGAYADAGVGSMLLRLGIVLKMNSPLAKKFNKNKK